MLEAIFLGIVQGLTEFLPISSSAHIRILGEFLPSAQDPGATFTAIMQIGTEIAVLIYFRSDIARLVISSLRWIKRSDDISDQSRREARLAGLILVGSIPIFILGFFGQEYIRENFRSLYLIAFTLIILAYFLVYLIILARR